MFSDIRLSARHNITEHFFLDDDWCHKEWQFGWDCEELSSDELFD
jgi:hypothetical protein